MWCLQQNIYIRAQYLLGILNCTLNKESRVGGGRSIRLKIRSPDLCEHQQPIWATGSGPLASRLTQSVPLLFQLAVRSICRGNRYLPPGLVNREDFAIPSWNLVPRVIRKMRTQEADEVLVAPVWKAQPWYALLLAMLVDWPHLIPKQPMANYICTMSLVPQLAIWRISLGRNSNVKAFQVKLQTLSSSCGGPKQINFKTHSSGNGIARVVNGALIHFQGLWAKWLTFWHHCTRKVVSITLLLCTDQPFHQLMRTWVVYK